MPHIDGRVTASKIAASIVGVTFAALEVALHITRTRMLIFLIVTSLPISGGAGQIRPMLMKPRGGAG
jgi:hypothetical protein